MAVLIRMSACGKVKDRYMGEVVNNIPTVCMWMIYLFTAVKTHNNYHNFIYALNGHRIRIRNVTESLSKAQFEGRYGLTEIRLNRAKCHLGVVEAAL